MHVVMLVHNDVTTDARVMREAAWLARAGLQVTLLGVAAHRDIAPLDRALVARVPLAGELTRLQALDRRRRREWRPLPPPWGTREQREDAESLRRGLAGYDLPSRARAPRRLAARGAGAVARVVDAGVGRAWEAYDRRRAGSSRVHWDAVVGGMVADVEHALGPVVDGLQPDVVHAHEVYTLGVAVQAARRARARGREVRVVYDAHEYVPGMPETGNHTPEVIAAWAGFEAALVHAADAVITVGAGIAEVIRTEHGLAVTPDVVLNVPVTEEPGVRPVASEPPRDVRADCGLAPDVRLLVYSGGIREVRGVDTSISALAALPGCHLAVVCVPSSSDRRVDRLRTQAAALGCLDRVHFLDPVPPGRVVDYLAGADVGLIPIDGGWPNHELTMPNKFFEYLQAGLPLVVSDLAELGPIVREDRIGATFAPRDHHGLARAAQQVLADLDGYGERVRASRWRVEGDWRVQESRLRAVYERLLGARLRPGGDGDGADGGAGALDRRPLRLEEVPARRADDLPPRVLLGPHDAEGRLAALAEALRAECPQVEVQVLAIAAAAGAAGVDLPVRRADYHRSLPWQIGAVRHLLGSVTHAVFEQGSPLAGSAMGATCLREARYLTAAGARCAVLLHEEPHPLVREQLPELAALGVPVLLTRPELADGLPGAIPLPAGAGAATAQALAAALGLTHGADAPRADAPRADAPRADAPGVLDPGGGAAPAIRRSQGGAPPVAHRRASRRW